MKYWVVLNNATSFEASNLTRTRGDPGFGEAKFYLYCLGDLYVRKLEQPGTTFSGTSTGDIIQNEL